VANSVLSVCSQAWRFGRTASPSAFDRLASNSLLQELSR